MQTVSQERIFRWAQLQPEGGPGWWASELEATQHRLVGLRPSSRRSTSGWHGGSSFLGKASAWALRAQDAWTALSGGFDGILTHFPPLAATTGLLSRCLRRPMLIAHNFNLGHIPRGLSRRCARSALKSIDRFIVHARREVAVYSELLNVPATRFEFVRLHKAPLVEAEVELPEAPFVFAGGSAHRDYATLLEACKATALPTVVVAGRMHLDTLASAPPNVEVRTGLSLAQCNRLVRAARLHVVPIHKTPTSAGQVALVTGLVAGTPTIASRAIGTEDYLEDGRTGLMVDPGDASGLADRMRLLWDDAGLRDRIRHSASQFAAEELSEQAGLSGLLRVLDSVVADSDSLQ